MQEAHQENSCVGKKTRDEKQSLDCPGKVISFNCKDLDRQPYLTFCY